MFVASKKLVIYTNNTVNEKVERILRGTVGAEREGGRERIAKDSGALRTA